MRPEIRIYLANLVVNFLRYLGMFLLVVFLISIIYSIFFDNGIYLNQFTPDNDSWWWYIIITM